MPRNLPHYTTCAAPEDAYSFTEGANPFLQALLAILVGGVAAGAFWTVMTLLALATTAGCVIGIGIGALLVSGIIQFKYWYYNRRLMCVVHDQCVVGTVVGEPHDAKDGDRKLDLLVAPFDVPGTEQKLIGVLDELRGELSAVPDVADLQNRQVRFGYIRGLGDAELRKVYFKLTDEKMFVPPADFLRKFYRRSADPAIMPAGAFVNSPDDTAPGGNPMFRYTHAEGDDPEEKVLVPWLHCEVEGNRLERWLNNVLVGLIAGLATFVAICVACDVLTLGVLDFLCGILGGVAALIIAFLAWLISHLINDPNEGTAGSIDVDVEDAGFDTPPATAQHGDVVFIYGNWIMDEEHGKYFEVHPVKAYYLLCRNAVDPENWDLTEETPASDCGFDVTQLTGEYLERLCKIVKAVENTDPDEKFTTTIPAALAMMG